MPYTFGSNSIRYFWVGVLLVVMVATGMEVYS